MVTALEVRALGGRSGGLLSVVLLLAATLAVSVCGDRGDPAARSTPTRVARAPTGTATKTRATPTATAPPPTPIAARQATPEVASSPTPTTVPLGELAPLGAKFAVANTGGDGVALRPSPGSDEAIRAWSDGTVMVIVGSDRQEQGSTWRNVRDPEGNVGWVAAAFLVPAP